MRARGLFKAAFCPPRDRLPGDGDRLSKTRTG